MDYGLRLTRALTTRMQEDVESHGGRLVLFQVADKLEPGPARSSGPTGSTIVSPSATRAELGRRERRDGFGDGADYRRGLEGGSGGLTPESAGNGAGHA